MQINFNYFNNRNTVLRPNEITQREGFYKSFYLLQITGHFIWGNCYYKDIFQNNWIVSQFSKGDESSSKNILKTSLDFNYVKPCLDLIQL